MSDFPIKIFNARETENLPGIVYDEDKKQNLFSEDFQNLGAEITSIETILGTLPSGAYSTVRAWLEALDSKPSGGSVWYTGSGVPSDSVGNNGDFYLRSSNGAVYYKVSGSWGSSILIIKGVDGSNGQGVPVGGTAGQVLKKIDSANYNTEWGDGGSGGGSIVVDNGAGLHETSQGNLIISHNLGKVPKIIRIHTIENNPPTGNKASFCNGSWIDSSNKCVYMYDDGSQCHGSSRSDRCIYLWSAGGNVSAFIIDNVTDSSFRLFAAINNFDFNFTWDAEA